MFHVELKEIFNPVTAIWSMGISISLSSDWVDKEVCIFVENMDFIIALVHQVRRRTHQGAMI